MGDQEGMFYSQDQQAQEERPIKEHNKQEKQRVKEEATWQEPGSDPHPGYEEGYVSTPYPDIEQREKIQPQQRRTWKPTRLNILALITLLCMLLAAIRFDDSFFTFILPIMIILAFLGFTKMSRDHTRLPANMRPSEHKFVVDGQATLILDNRAGSIQIRRGARYSVEIKSLGMSRGRFVRFENVQHNYEQRGDKILVKEPPWGRGAWMNPIEINYEILLPEQSDIHIAQNAGNIGIEGVKGKISISMNAGNVSLKGVHLKGQSVLGVNGGNITINGSLEKGGRTTLRSNAGNIDITLPAESAFQFNGHTTAGNIVNQFDSPAVREQSDTQLEAYTNVGSIHVRKR